MMTTALVRGLKKAEQDFEFYPTTTEILELVKRNMPKNDYNSNITASVLDCGAGDGRVLISLTEGARYAIEKSPILVNNMDSSIFVVGCDFHENTLIDKKVDVVFSNPPYSEYEEWVLKIITQANAKKIFLVLPERWKKQPGIIAAIEEREAKWRILGSFDFLKADRVARAKVDVVEISMISFKGQGEPNINPFELWVSKTFPLNERQSEEPEEESFKRRVSELVSANGFIPALVELYNYEMQRLQSNFKSISQLDPEIFAELDVDFKSMTKFLHNRIAGLKEKYWREVFDKYNSITSRLTVKSRKMLLDTLTANVSVDFTESNIYAVTAWAVRNANKYFDVQLIKTFERLVSRANVVVYKSNKNTWGEDGWRFNREYHDGGVTHFGLDYRCVIECYNTFPNKVSVSFEYPNGLYKDVHNLLNDILVVAGNLGFSCPESERSERRRAWSPRKAQDFVMVDGKILMSVRAYKNGNLHIKFNQNFLRRWNVEFGRLKGWLRAPKQAADELGMSAKEAEKAFNSNLTLDCSNAKLLEG